MFAEFSGDPMRRDNGTFFTTEDQFFTNQSRVDALRLEANVSRAQSLDAGTLAKMYVLRRILMPMGSVDAIEFLLNKLKETKDNEEFYSSMNN